MGEGKNRSRGSGNEEFIKGGQREHSQELTLESANEIVNELVRQSGKSREQVINIIGETASNTPPQIVMAYLSGSRVSANVERFVNRQLKYFSSHIDELKR